MESGIEVRPPLTNFHFIHQNTESDSWKLVGNGNLEVLGEGAYGYVFKARIQKNGVQLSVAIKTIKPIAPPSFTKMLLKELQMMKYVGRHRHVAQLLGGTVAMIEANQQLVIVLPVYENGSLLHYLTRLKLEMCPIGSKLCPATSRIVINLGRWASEICTGMEFLSEKKVVHCDLATRNILLDGHCTAKISDFGLSVHYAQAVAKDHQVAWRWAALETMLIDPSNPSYFSEKSDVWSFGVTLWEIFTLGEEPYSGICCDYSFIQALKNGTRLGKPLHANSKYYDLMLETWSEDPRDRPTFRELSEMLPIKTNPYLFVMYSDVLDGITYSEELLEHIEDTAECISSFGLWSEIAKSTLFPWSPFLLCYYDILTRTKIQNLLVPNSP